MYAHRARRRRAERDRATASPSRSPRAGSSRSCCSPPRAGFGMLERETTQLLVMVVTVSMLLAPALFVLHERLLARWLERTAAPEFDTIDEPGNPVIIAGYGRFGQIVSRVLRDVRRAFHGARGELPAGRFRAPLRQQGLLRRRLAPRAAAGGAGRRTRSCSCWRSTTWRPRCGPRRLVRRHFPQLPILARARNRVHYFAAARPRRQVDLPRDVSRRASRRRTRRCCSSGWASRPRSAPSRCSSSTTRRSSRRSTPCATTTCSSSRTRRTRRSSCGGCSSPTWRARWRACCRRAGDARVGGRAAEPGEHELRDEP